jgi:ABC-type multidrug transport system fused ATPase/permease subunit
MLRPINSTQFLETLEGLSTIRAFGWQQSYVQHHQVLVDNAQKPFYLLFMIQKWLVLVLDLMIAALAVLVVSVIVALRRDVSVGFSGVSLTQIMGLTGYIKLLIQFWTSMETSLGAVFRVKQFVSEAPNERKTGEQLIAPKSWPTKGEIVLNDVCAVYR